jgi:sugar phosphate isomerase/epimerase
MLVKADAMGCRSVVTLAGSKHPSGHVLAPHPGNFTDAYRGEFREFVLRVLDGLALASTKYIIEPWHNTFFYRPDDIAAFIVSVDHPSFGLHLDQMNMVDQAGYLDTTSLIDRTFDLLADHVVSVHLKDVLCDPGHLMLKYDEVLIGEGVMDYETYMKRLAGLDEDVPCYTEHLPGEQAYIDNTRRAHAAAERVGVAFRRRSA